MQRDLEPQSSDNEQMLSKIDNRDKLIRAIELLALGLLVVFSVWSSLSLNSFIRSSQTETLKARAANAQRQQEQKDYIKCLVLLKFDAPQLNKDSSRAETEAALDKCANTTNGN